MTAVQCPFVFSRSTCLRGCTASDLAKTNPSQGRRHNGLSCVALAFHVALSIFHFASKVLLSDNPSFRSTFLEMQCLNQPSCEASYERTECLSALDRDHLTTPLSQHIELSFFKVALPPYPLLFLLWTRRIQFVRLSGTFSEGAFLID